MGMDHQDPQIPQDDGVGGAARFGPRQVVPPRVVSRSSSGAGKGGLRHNSNSSAVLGPLVVEFNLPI